MTRARRPTIVDVARLAGVSKSLVSRALNGSGGVSPAALSRIRAAADELGYVANAMARGMVASRTYTIGVFVRDAATPFYGHLLTAMQERAAEHGYRVITATGSGRFALDAERRALETLVMVRVEGLVICSGLLPDADVARFSGQLPTVLAGRPPATDEISAVYCDEVGGGAALAGHVLALGHRDVAVLTVPPESSLSMSVRTRSMVETLRNGGARVWEHPTPLVEDVPDGLSHVLARSTTTAAMAPSDRHALRALEVLRDRGLRAPEDLSLTGYDGVPLLDSSYIGLTGWRQPLRRIGSNAVDMLLARVDESPQPPSVRLAGELVPGRTCTARDG